LRGRHILFQDNVLNAKFLSEIPSNLVLKKVTPRIWLPCLTFCWGVVAMSLGFVNNNAEFIVVRALLGLTEGGLLPGMVSLSVVPEGLV
jgi:MFS family permease